MPTWTSQRLVYVYLVGIQIYNTPRDISAPAASYRTSDFADSAPCRRPSAAKRNSMALRLASILISFLSDKSSGVIRQRRWRSEERGSLPLGQLCRLTGATCLFIHFDWRLANDSSRSNVSRVMGRGRLLMSRGRGRSGNLGKLIIQIHKVLSGRGGQANTHFRKWVGNCRPPPPPPPHAPTPMPVSDTCYRQCATDSVPASVRTIHRINHPGSALILQT